MGNQEVINKLRGRLTALSTPKSKFLEEFLTTGLKGIEKERKSMFRILPGKDGNPFFELWLHNNLETLGFVKEYPKRWGSFACYKKSPEIMEQCPFCKYGQELMVTGDKDTASNYFSKAFAYCAVLEVETVKPLKYKSDEIKILQLRKGEYLDVVTIMCNEEYGDITDFEEGRVVTFTRSKTGPKPIDVETIVIASPSLAPIPKEKFEPLLPDLRAESLKGNSCETKEKVLESFNIHIQFLKDPSKLIEALPNKKSGETSDSPTPKNEEVVKTAPKVESRQPEAKPKIPIPNGAPECYGSDYDSTGKWVGYEEEREMCKSCAFDVICESISAPLKK